MYPTVHRWYMLLDGWWWCIGAAGQGKSSGAESVPCNDNTVCWETYGADWECINGICQHVWGFVGRGKYPTVNHSTILKLQGVKIRSRVHDCGYKVWRISDARDGGKKLCQTWNRAVPAINYTISAFNTSNNGKIYYDIVGISNYSVQIMLVLISYNLWSI